MSRQIALNGTVNSYAGSTTGLRGGNIWFYNAGGILIGGNAAINVGSMVRVERLSPAIHIHPCHCIGKPRGLG